MVIHTENCSVSQRIVIIRELILHKFLSRFVRRKPADVDNFVVFIQVTDWHWHIVVRGNNLNNTFNLESEFR